MESTYLNTIISYLKGNHSLEFQHRNVTANLSLNDLGISMEFYQIVPLVHKDLTITSEKYITVLHLSQGGDIISFRTKHGDEPEMIHNLGNETTTKLVTGIRNILLTSASKVIQEATLLSD